MLAQDPAYTLLTEEDGLPSNEVYYVTQDSLGYVWFGTDNGVCRYNGRNFKTFRSPRQKSQAMHNLYVGKKGRIWMSNFSDQIFYIENDSLYEWQPLVEAGLGVEFFTYRYPYIYLGYQGIVHLYNLQDSSWTNLSSRYFSKERSQRTHFSSIGPIILGTKEYLWRFEGPKGYPLDLSQVTRRGGAEMPNAIGLERVSLGDGILYSMFSGSKAYGEQNVYSLNDMDEYVPLQIPGWPAVGEPERQINRVMQVDSNTYWTLTNEGAASFNPTLSPHPPLQFFFKDFRPSCILRDQEGNHWFSTLGQGVIFVPFLNNSVYTPTRPGPYKLSDLRVRCLATDGNDRLWIGHQNGKVDVWSSASSYSFFSNGAKQEINGLHWDEPTQQMYIAQNGILQMQGLQKIHSYKGASCKDCFPFSNTVFGAGSARMIAFLRFGEKGPVLGWDRSLPFIHPPTPYISTQPVYISENPAADRLIFSIRRSWTVHVDSLLEKEFRIWQGYVDTLRYTNSNGWTGSCQDPFTGAPIHARDIEQGKDSLIWVGTSNQGVYGIRDSQVVYHFSTSQGLPNNNTTSIYLEEDTLWVGSKEGLIRLVPKDTGVAVFDQTDGLVSTEVRDVIEWQGDIWLATYKGLQRIKRSELKPNKVPPKIRLIRTAIMEKDTLFPYGASLPFSLNNLRFDFEGLAFRSKGRFFYRYRMLGLDSQWVSIPSTQNSIRFPSIPPGDFRFEIIAVNEDGITSEKAATFAFSILKPWYRSWWFYMALALGIGGIVSLGFSLRLRQERTRRRFEKQLDNLKMSALQAQMNPHFIFNALNAIQYYFTKNQAETALSYLSKFAKLIRTIFEHARLPRITLGEEITFLKLYSQLEQLRFSDKVSVEWDLDPELDVGIEIPPLLIQPLLENSFKYGLLHKPSPGTLAITLRQGQKQVYICIEDDGVGREAALRLRKPRLNRQQSAGIETIEERLNIYHKEIGKAQKTPLVITDLYDQDGKAIGTRVELFIAIE